MTPAHRPAPAWPATPVTGRNLRPGGFARQLGPGPTLIAFLRHPGCLFCREAVRALRGATADGTAVHVVLVAPAPAADLDALFARMWPGAPVVADPSGALLRAAGGRRGRLAEVVGPAAAVCAVRAVARGARPGRPAGDVRALPAALLVDGDEVLWAHHGRHSGDTPDWTTALGAAAGRAAA